LKCAIALAALLALPLSGQPAPEDCFATVKDVVVETVSYSGRTYTFKKEGCRALFESDPERYGQLFDALGELAAAGTVVKAEQASLVPS
jgi:YHS domain-containing protein